MNNLQDRITSDLKIAMKNRDALRLETLRSIKTAFTNELVQKARTPQDNLSDEEATAVIKRLHKQRQDAGQQFSQAGRDDLATKEKQEAEILAEYLPKQLDDQALTDLVDQVITDLGDDFDQSKIGIVIGQVMKRSSGRADGKRVQKMVASKLR